MEKLSSDYRLPAAAPPSNTLVHSSDDLMAHLNSKNPISTELNPTSTAPSQSINPVVDCLLNSFFPSIETPN
jgi:hypothetical protein